jgi:hypothetical protein
VEVGLPTNWVPLSEAFEGGNKAGGIPSGEVEGERSIKKRKMIELP